VVLVAALDVVVDVVVVVVAAESFARIPPLCAVRPILDIETWSLFQLRGKIRRNPETE